MWLNIISLALSLIGNLVGWLNNRQMLDAGADREIAKQTAAILAMTQRGQQIMGEVQEMSDDQLNDFLKELGRG